MEARQCIPSQSTQRPVLLQHPVSLSFKVTVSNDKIPTFKLRKYVFIIMSLTSYLSNEIGGANNSDFFILYNEMCHVNIWNICITQ